MTLTGFLLLGLGWDYNTHQRSWGVAGEGVSFYVKKRKTGKEGVMKNYHQGLFAYKLIRPDFCVYTGRAAGRRRRAGYLVSYLRGSIFTQKQMRSSF
jgi:hypothetical protein